VSDLFFADLTSPQIKDLLGADPPTVLLLPVGATEPHGPHAPLSTDSLISMSMCQRAARHLTDDPQVRALVLPAVPYGVTRYSAAFAGAVHVEADTLHALVVDICTSLVAQGLRHLVIVNSHFEPEHVAALRRVVNTMQAERGIAIGFLDLVRRRNAERLTEEFRSGECHAGRYETSLVLADHPHLVDRESMRHLPRVAVNMPAAIAEGRTDFVAMGMDQAYCGAPADATAAEGEATLGTLTDMLVDVVRDVATRS
jgi:creatinine amidohydrolase